MAMKRNDERPTVHTDQPQEEPPTIEASQTPRLEPTMGPAQPGLGAKSGSETQIIGRPPSSFAWLIVKEGSRAGRLYRLNPDGTSVGRDAQNDVILDDSTISRQHAKLRMEGEGDEARYFIFDLATPNGTLVNDQRIVKQALEDGDQVRIGQVVFVFKQIK